MIEGLRVRNFQAHKSFSLKFDPHITTIIGPSDVGKSSLLRALYWLVYNRPSGSDFIRHGRKDCRVQVKIDGHTIERRRGSQNLYILDGDEFKAFGNDVPDSISRLINLDRINFQWQHDPLFWFSLSPGQVSKELNRIVDLEVIDRTVRNVSSAVKEAEYEVRHCEDSLTETKERIKELEWVDDCDEDLKSIETLENDINRKTSDVDSLTRFLQEVRNHEETRDRLGESRRDGQKLISQGKDLLKRKEIVKSLTKLLRQHQEMDTSLIRLKVEVKSLKRKLPKVCPICQSPLKY